MSTLYVDLSTGSDANAGTNPAAPCLTINGAIAKAGGPHTICVAKTTAAASVGGGTTFTWTRNSTIVSTSTDLTASIAAGNYIGRPTATGNGSVDTFYRVTSITATTITLTSKNQNATGTTTGCLKLVLATQIVTTGSAAANACTISTSGTIISGGWDLSGTPTQNGETWFRSNNVRTTTFYGIAVTATNCSVSNLNVIDNGYGITCTTTGVTVANCTFSTNLNSGFYNNAGFSGSHTSCVFQTEGQVPFYTQAGTVRTFESCYFMNGSVACFQQATFSIYSAILTFSNCGFYGGALGISHAPPDDISCINCAIEYCTSGITHTALSLSVSGVNFLSCTTGISVSSLNNLSVRSCTFTSCTTGIGTRSYGLRVDDCTFTSCATGVSLDQFSSNAYITNCSFVTPVTYGVFKDILASTVHLSGCTIDAPNEAKLFTNTSGTYNTFPAAIIKNSGNTLWPDGYYYPYHVFVKDSSTTHSIAPSMRYQNSTTLAINSFTEQPIASCFTASASGKTITFWMKCNSTWSGTINPYWRLNGSLIQSEDQIITLSTSWTQYTYSVSSGLITTDGELQLGFVVNANTIAFFVDDVSWS